MLHILTQAGPPPPPSPARAAIVSVVIGERHTAAWVKLCCGSWIAYAERCGLDIIVVAEPIDPHDSSRSPAWQKLLIANQPWAPRYERLVWLDSDILIGERAPDILDYAGPPEKVSLCYDAACISPVEGQIYIERSLDFRLRPRNFETDWRMAQRQRYLGDATPPHEVMFNTGVMVVSPAHHNALLLEAYQRPQMTQLYEQTYLSHRLIELDLAHVLSPRFNWGLAEAVKLFVNSGQTRASDGKFIAEATHVLLRAEMQKAYFLHFYGAMNLLMHYAGLPALQAEAA